VGQPVHQLVQTLTSLIHAPVILDLKEVVMLLLVKISMNVQMTLQYVDQVVLAITLMVLMNALVVLVMKAVARLHHAQMLMNVWTLLFVALEELALTPLGALTRARVVLVMKVVAKLLHAQILTSARQGHLVVLVECAPMMSVVTVVLAMLVTK